MKCFLLCCLVMSQKNAVLFFESLMMNLMNYQSFFVRARWSIPCSDTLNSLKYFELESFLFQSTVLSQYLSRNCLVSGWISDGSMSGGWSLVGSFLNDWAEGSVSAGAMVMRQHILKESGADMQQLVSTQQTIDWPCWLCPSGLSSRRRTFWCNSKWSEREC